MLLFADPPEVALRSTVTVVKTNDVVADLKQICQSTNRRQSAAVNSSWKWAKLQHYSKKSENKNYFLK